MKLYRFGKSKHLLDSLLLRNGDSQFTGAQASSQSIGREEI
jgi:hypothetical protein